MDLALNNLQRLISHKAELNKPINRRIFPYYYIFFFRLVSKRKMWSGLSSPNVKPSRLRLKQLKNILQEYKRFFKKYNVF